jgi:hypothetical protein
MFATQVCDGDVVFRRELLGALPGVDGTLLEDFRPIADFSKVGGGEFCAGL